MKKIFIAIALLVSLNVSAQTTMTAGIFGAYSFSKGDIKGTFKEGLITQVNYTMGKFTTSAVTIGVTDSLATGYIGTGVSYSAWRSEDTDKELFIGVDALKGEKNNGIGGVGLTYRQSRNLIGLHLQNDFVNGQKWLGLTFQTFLFDN